MNIFTKAKIQKSDDQRNIKKYRVSANIIEYHSVSKFNFIRIMIQTFMMIRYLFDVKKCRKQIQKCLKSIGQF